MMQDISGFVLGSKLVFLKQTTTRNKMKDY